MKNSKTFAKKNLLVVFCVGMSFVHLFFTRKSIWVAIIYCLLISILLRNVILKYAGFQAVSVSIICLVIHWLWDKSIFQKIKSFRFTILTAPFIFFFFIQVVWAFPTHFSAQAMQAISVKLCFFILPICFSTENYFTEKLYHQSMVVFTIIMILGLIYSLFCSYYNHHHEGGWYPILNRMSISEAIMHPGYYSNFVMYSIIWCAYLIIYSEKFGFKKYKIQVFIFIPLLLLMLVSLLSRTVLLHFIFFSLGIFFLFFKRIKNLVIRWILFLGTLFLFFNVLLAIPSIKGRYDETIVAFKQKKINKEGVNYTEATQSRSVVYKLELEIIKKYWLMGTGTGTAFNMLQQKLHDEKYIGFYKTPINTHQQYFHTWIEQGMVGISLLLICIFGAFYFFYTKNNFIGCWFVLLLVFNLLTDDMLEIESGCIFFIFILQTLFYTPLNNGLKNEKY